RQAHVDRDGGFAIDALPPGQLWITASDGESSSKPRAIDLSADSARAAIKLTLENDGAIAGVGVDHSGAPVEGAQVVGVRADSLDPAANAATTTYELSDSSGKFALHGLVPGNYQLSATRDPQHAGGARKTSAKTGATDVKITLSSAGAIKGRVAFK